MNQIFAFCKEVAYAFNSKSCSTRSSALAFTTLFSLVPLMTVGFTILKGFPAFTGLEQQVQDFILQNFVAARADEIQAYLNQFSAQVLKISAPSMLILLLTAVLL